MSGEQLLPLDDVNEDPDEADFCAGGAFGADKCGAWHASHCLDSGKQKSGQLYREVMRAWHSTGGVQECACSAAPLATRGGNGRRCATGGTEIGIE